jgi:hypothetical protein
MRTLAGLIALITLVGGLAIESAAAVGSVLYLRGQAVPSSPMSISAPPPGSLPNFDPRRDDFPGLLIQKGSGSADEGDPTKFQEWSHPVGGETLSIDEFVIWAAPKDLNEDKTMIFNVYVLDCGGSCQTLDSASVAVSGAGWSQAAVDIDIENHTFAPGRKLTVKVVVDNGSDDDGWFAFATASYPAHLALSSAPATTTTTTTTTPTTPTPIVTTPTPAAPTTSTPTDVSPATPTRAPSEPAATSTTAPQPDEGTTSTTTTTTLPVRGGTGPGLPPSGPPSGGNDAGSAVSASQGPSGGLAPVIALPAQGDVGMVAQPSGSPRTIEPEEGLMVAFDTTVEAIRMYWMSALALGTLAAILLLIGIRRDHEDESLATTSPLPHRLIGFGWHTRSDS